MKNLTWQNPEQLFVAQVLINKVKSKCCGIKAFYSFSIRFEHMPTLLNYWHFEMKLCPSLEEVFPRKSEKKAWMKKMIDDFLQNQFVLAMVEDEEDAAKINSSYYLKAQN